MPAAGPRAPGHRGAAQARARAGARPARPGRRSPPRSCPGRRCPSGRARGEQHEGVQVQAGGQLVQVAGAARLGRQHRGQPLRRQLVQHAVVEHAGGVHHRGSAGRRGVDPRQQRGDAAAVGDVAGDHVGAGPARPARRPVRRRRARRPATGWSAPPRGDPGGQPAGQVRADRAGAAGDQHVPRGVPRSPASGAAAGARTSRRPSTPRRRIATWSSPAPRPAPRTAAPRPRSSRPAGRSTRPPQRCGCSSAATRPRPQACACAGLRQRLAGRPTTAPLVGTPQRRADPGVAQRLDQRQRPGAGPRARAGWSAMRRLVQRQQRQHPGDRRARLAAPRSAARPDGAVGPPRSRPERPGARRRCRRRSARPRPVTSCVRPCPAGSDHQPGRRPGRRAAGSASGRQVDPVAPGVTDRPRDPVRRDATARAGQHRASGSRPSRPGSRASGPGRRRSTAAQKRACGSAAVRADRAGAGRAPASSAALEGVGGQVDPCGPANTAAQSTATPRDVQPGARAVRRAACAASRRRSHRRGRRLASACRRPSRYSATAGEHRVRADLDEAAVGPSASQRADAGVEPHRLAAGCGTSTPASSACCPASPPVTVETAAPGRRAARPAPGPVSIVLRSPRPAPSARRSRPGSAAP